MIKKLYPVICLLLLCNTGAFAQVSAWAGGADYNDFSFGFHFQYINNDYKVVKKSNWRTPYFDAGSGHNVTDSLTSISSGVTQGFGVGFLARMRVTDNVELRSTPSLIFADRTVSYQYKTTTQNIDKTINASYFEIPLLLKIKSDRLGNFRAYLIGGVKYSYGISAPKKEDPNESPLDKSILNQRSYASYDAGVGCDIYYTYFKFSPEIRLSNSFGNVLVAADNPYSSPIQKLFLHSLVFTIYFE
jgi:hypothetical protein